VIANSITLPTANANTVRPLHVMLMLSVVMCVALWCVQSVFGVSAHAEGMEFGALLTLYALASLMFLLPRTKADHLPFFQIPVFFTLTSFIRFGAAPAFAFIDEQHFDDNLHGDYGALVRTLLLWMVGMCAYWLACALLRDRTKEPGRLIQKGMQPRRLWGTSSPALIALLTVLGTGANIYNFRTFRGISLDDYMASASSVGVVNFLADLSAYALVLAAIEYYENPKGGWQKLFLAVTLGLQCVWGFTAMMKAEMIRPLLLVALVASFVRSKFDKKWMGVAVLGLVIVYPLQKEFRRIQGGYNLGSAQSFESATRDAMHTTASSQSGVDQWLSDGFDSLMLRLDDLQPMAVVLSFNRAQQEFLKGDERWWMIPYYPFTPRFLWPSKPALLAGQRVSLLLGIGYHTSTAITYAGDCFIRHGMFGMLCGMFVLGLMSQYFTNTVSGQCEKRDLLVYCSVFWFMANNMVESDAFSLWCLIIKTVVCLRVICWVLYGPPLGPKRRKALAEAEAGHKPVAAVFPAPNGGAAASALI
jgi:hypothetical protein